MAEFQQKEHFWLFSYTEPGKQPDGCSPFSQPHWLVEVRLSQFISFGLKDNTCFLFQPHLGGGDPLGRPAVQNDHPLDGNLLPLGVLLKVFP